MTRSGSLSASRSRWHAWKVSFVYARIGTVGGAYVPALFAGMYAPLRRTYRKWYVCPARDPILSGAYITTKGVVTYAPPGGTPFFKMMESKAL